MVVSKKFSAFAVLALLCFHACCMETPSIKPKKWYEHIDFLVGLFGQQNIQGRQRQMHRDSSEKNVPDIDQMEHIALFAAISKNDVEAVRSIYSKNNVVDINYRESKKNQTLLIAALKNFKKQKENREDLSEVKKAQDIIGIMCDPTHSISMDMELLRKAQEIATKYSEKYGIPELKRALELIVVNKKAALIMENNGKKMNNPEELKNFQKLSGVREDSFFLASKQQKNKVKNESEQSGK
ncbi:hypothetical protein HYX58_05865 [Candidatus Dependentiae bacterium]|nr:hypothetical protein [Candidatus Dependentiae bacterium]